MTKLNKLIEQQAEKQFEHIGKIMTPTKSTKDAQIIFKCSTKEKNELKVFSAKYEISITSLIQQSLSEIMLGVKNGTYEISMGHIKKIEKASK